MNNQSIAHLKVQELQTGMKVNLYDINPSEKRVECDNEWITITQCSGYGNVTVIENSHQRYEVKNDTMIPVCTS